MSGRFRCGGSCLVLAVLLQSVSIGILSAAESPEETVLSEAISLRQRGDWSPAWVRLDSLESATRNRTDLAAWLRHSIEIETAFAARCLALSPTDSIRVARADSLEGSSRELFEQARFREVIPPAREAADLWTRALGHRHFRLVEPQKNLAMGLARLQQFAEADSLLEQALTDGAAALGEEHPEIASVHSSFGWSLIFQARYSEAEVHLQRSLDIRQRCHSSEDERVVTAMLSMAGLYIRTNRLDDCETMLHQALDVYRKRGDETSQGYGYVVHELGSLHIRRGEPAKAEPFLQKALELWTEVLGPEHEWVATAVGTLGAVYRQTGRLSEAIRYYRRALQLKLATYGPDSRLVASARADLARALGNKGLDEEAEEQINLALAAVEEGRVPFSQKLENLLYAAGNMRRDAGRYQEAETLFRRGIAIREVLGRDAGMPLKGEANLYGLLVAAGSHDRADSLYHRIAEENERQKLTRPASYMTVMQFRARSLWYRGRTNEAVEIMSRVIEDVDVESLTQDRAYAFYEDLATMHLARNANEEACRWADLACRKYDQDEAFRDFGNHRTATPGPPHFVSAVALLRLGRESEAWDRILQGSSRNMQRVLQLDNWLRNEPTLRATLDSLRLEIDLLRGELSVLARSNDEKVHTETSWDLGATESELHAAVQTYRATLDSIGYLAHLDGSTPSADMEDLPPHDSGAALIGWIIVATEPDHDSVWGYLRRPDGTLVFRELTVRGDRGGTPPMIAAAVHYRRRLAMASAWPGQVSFDANDQRAAEEVFRLWVRPLLDELEEPPRVLAAVLAGPVLGIPLDCLIDDEGTFLGDRLTLLYAPSAATLGPGRANRFDVVQNPLRRALLMGDPYYSPVDTNEVEKIAEGAGHESGSNVQTTYLTRNAVLEACARSPEVLAELPRLPWSRREILEVADFVDDPVIRLGTDASEGVLLDLARNGELREFEILHFSSHALFAPGQPYRSAIVLNQVGLPDPMTAILNKSWIEDGMLTVPEISRDLDLEAELVVLGACQTGLGDHAEGEGSIGLTYAFLNSGARYVLSSYWKVNDHPTYLFMTRFYAKLAEACRDDAVSPGAMARAAREARIWVREWEADDGTRPYEHPVYWAGFALNGFVD